MPTLKEVLADRAKYQDNLSWQLENGVSVTLGQLRQLSDERQAAIVKAEQDITAREAAAKAAEDKLKKTQLDVANVYTTLNAAVEAIKNGRLNDPSVQQIFGNITPGNVMTPPDPFAELARLEQDTLLGPVVKALKAVNDNAKKAQEAVVANINTQKLMAESYLNGTLEDRYDRLVPEDKKDKISLESLIKSAVENNEYKSDRTPDIRRAYKRLTAGDELAAREAQIRADERKKFQEELAAKGGDINVPVPTSSIFGLDVHNRGGAAPKPFANLDEAFKAAQADKDIWSAVDQVTH
jgi:hypothetical protein